MGRRRTAQPNTRQQSAVARCWLRAVGTSAAGVATGVPLVRLTAAPRARSAAGVLRLRRRRGRRHPPVAPSWRLGWPNSGREASVPTHLRNPSAAWVIPAKNVAVKASRVYSSGCFLGSISFWRRVPSSSETTATGPMAISLELPIIAYIKGGTKLLSEKSSSFSQQASSNRCPG